MPKVMHVHDQSGAIKPWFLNAFKTVKPSSSLKEIFEEFERVNGVRLIRQHSNIQAVEFQNEQEAIMFMLRWG